MTTVERPALERFSRVTIGEKYGYAMTIETEGEALEYLDACIEHTMSFGATRVEAERIERANLGYYAGYYDHATRQRVERLFSCAHPIFGKAAADPVDPTTAILAGAVAATNGVGLARHLAARPASTTGAPRVNADEFSRGAR